MAYQKKIFVSLSDKSRDILAKFCAARVELRSVLGGTVIAKELELRITAAPPETPNNLISCHFRDSLGLCYQRERDFLADIASWVGT
jgi:hypothetical protein